MKNLCFFSHIHLKKFNLLQNNQQFLYFMSILSGVPRLVYSTNFRYLWILTMSWELRTQVDTDYLYEYLVGTFSVFAIRYSLLTTFPRIVGSSNTSRRQLYYRHDVLDHSHEATNIFHLVNIIISIVITISYRYYVITLCTIGTRYYRFNVGTVYLNVRYSANLLRVKYYNIYNCIRHFSFEPYLIRRLQFDMNWSNEMYCKFLKLYEQQPYIWNSKHKSRKLLNFIF